MDFLHKVGARICLTTNLLTIGRDKFALKRSIGRDLLLVVQDDPSSHNSAQSLANCEYRGVHGLLSNAHGVTTSVKTGKELLSSQRLFWYPCFLEELPEVESLNVMIRRR
jgi:hypothetical protein